MLINQKKGGVYMKTIEIDDDVYDELGKIAKPFVDNTPSMVIRKLIAYYSKQRYTVQDKKISDEVGSSIESNRLVFQSTSSDIEQLRKETSFVHQAFLTFLMDNYTNSTGNFQISDIIPFMEAFNLRLPSGLLRNPWMKAPYRSNKSCINTIEHFRQTRKFGCWNGKDTKENCNAENYCIYHPNNEHKINNKCDLRFGVIWKRDNPNSPFTYGIHYIEVIENELLENQKIPLKPLLAVLYPTQKYENKLVDRFLLDFHLDEEIDLFSDSDIWRHARQKGLIP